MIQPGPSNAGVNVAPNQVTNVGGVGNVGAVGNVGTVGSMGGVGNVGVGSVSAPLQRTYIWSGALEWMEKGKAPGDQQKVIKQLPCQVSANSKDIEPELKVDTWPSKLLMQLMPKQLISNIGGQYLKDSKSVLFHLQQNEALDALTKVMVGGFAGCVHFSPMPSPPQCDIKVLILLYTPDKKAYLGFIPNNQATFVDRLRKVIQQQKLSKQLPLAQQQQQGGLQHLQQQQGGMQLHKTGARGVPLDGLEAARQQNLEKIQHLQQTLEAAHQQEAQFKSQMDIMSHLHAAQQQEQHYKQLEEQRKHQLQLQQQQQQLQQQLRSAAPRLMRPHLPANPGLRHLLQQVTTLH